MCDKGLIVLRESKFELLDNDTFEIMGYNDSSPIICSNFPQNGTVSQNMTVFNYSYPPILSVLTYVGCSLSIVGCAAVLITYSLFKELRTLPGQILMNLVSTILATCFFLLVGIPIAVNQACRKAVCPVGLPSVIGSCAITLNIPQDGIFNSTNDPSMICDGALIVLQESEFELVDNYTLLFRNVKYNILGYIDDVPIVCSNFKQNGTSIKQVTVVNYSSPPIFSILTYVGCLLSIAGCVSVLLTYTLFKELRTLPGLILMNLVSTILATSLFILIGIPVVVLVEMTSYVKPQQYSYTG